ncbi:nucleoside-diphosphate kinase [Allokutzneria oryzae]|uniref:Nucleoside-diphosphate kinase n=1 Tax=Allokutzneria oryzae TaxID=1378989 RepID=A0ABV5ZXD0_9PSEU
MAHGELLSSELSRDPAKRELFGADTYYLESVEQLAELTDVEDFAYRHAVLLLKPDAVAARQLLQTVEWLPSNGFRIVAAERVTLTRHVVRGLWYFQWNLATPERRWLAGMLTAASDSLVLVVRADEDKVPASVLLTDRKGPTDPAARVPGQLRYELGRYSYLLNLVHTPDEPADVLRELGVYFGHDERAAVFASALAGADRSDRARELAEHLYRESRPKDLALEPALARLADSVGATPGTDPRELLDAVRRDGAQVDPWDLVIVGSHVLPMKRKQFSPVLDASSVEAWLTGGCDS